MKYIFQLILIALLCVIGSVAFATTSAPESIHSPVGIWKTIDDVTGQPKGIVELKLSDRNILTGKILKIYPRPGYDQNEVCSACEGERHNQRIVGMTFLEDLKQNPEKQNAWTSGKILDPKNGKTYHCNLTVIDNGQKLYVRGYIGFPLFGRTQTWLKVTNLQDT